jgi:hypothetical protein
VTDIGELVSVAIPDFDSSECPFDHRPGKHDKENELPPPSTVNDAKKLSDALDDESKHLENIPIRFKVGGTLRKSEAQYTAHHLIPGNETWPESKNQLRKWIDKTKGKVKGDIGYKVNAASNGVDLPGHSAVSTWSSSSEAYQDQYAFAAMEADKKARQFHDRHAAYSDFAAACLDKIAVKLDAREPNLGCGDEDCEGNTGPKYNPPYGLLERIHALAARLESFLHGSWKGWKKPIMTSRFALMYAEDLTQDEARGQLQRHKFNYGEDEEG